MIFQIAVSVNDAIGLARAFGASAGIFFALLFVLLQLGILHLDREVKSIVTGYEEQIRQKNSELDQWKLRFADVVGFTKTNASLTAEALQKAVGKN